MLNDTNNKEKRDPTEEVGVAIGVIIAVSVAIFVFFVGLPHSESALEIESGEFSLSEELLIRELTNTQNATTSATTTLPIEVGTATSS